MLTHFQEQLKENDDVLFLHGACHVFALALHQQFGYPLVLLQHPTVNHPKNAIHVYCRIDDVRLVDVVGIESEKVALCDLDSEWPNYPKRNISEKGLENFFTTESGGGLYVESEFRAITRARAQSLISKFADYYSGRFSSPVPDFSRRPAAKPEKTARLIFE